METDLAHTQAAGIAEHLVKPISAESLREMLARFSVEERDFPPARANNAGRRRLGLTAVSGDSTSEWV